MTSTRLPAAERRQAVLDTACRVFARKSYRSATTAEIAGACGISEPILYRHFGSKHELYAACLDAAWTAFEQEAEEAVQGDPNGCLGKVSQAFMRSDSRIRVTDLWLQALIEAEHDEVIADALREQVRRAHGFFAAAVRRGQASGAILAERDADAEAWIWVGGGLLSTLDQRLGGLLGGDVDRIRRERRRWLTGDETP